MSDRDGERGDGFHGRRLFRGFGLNRLSVGLRLYGLYAESAQGPWRAEPYAYRLAGAYTVWMKVSAPGLSDVIVSATVTVKDPSADNDGTFFFVAPAGESTPTAPYATWATAANDIPTAVAAATAGGRVCVKPGTYVLASEISIAKSLTLRSYIPATGEIDRDNTVVDANGAGRCLKAAVSAKADAVTVDGFTFRNGHKVSSAGGGVWFEDTEATKRSVLRNCRISKCSTDLAGGGGAYVKQYVTVTNCWFDSNICTNGHGGAVNVTGVGSSLYQARGTGPVFSGCTFTNNVATGKGGSGGAGCKGGAIAFPSGGAWVENSDFLCNTAMATNGNTRGGAILGAQGVTLAGSRFVNNRSVGDGPSSGNYGGSVFLAHNMAITNCLFHGGAGGYGAGICTGSQTFRIDDSTFENISGTAVFWDGSGTANPARFRNCLFKTCADALVVNSGNGVPTVEHCTFVGMTGNALRANATTGFVVRNSLFANNKTDLSAAATATPYQLSQCRYDDKMLPTGTVVTDCYPGLEPGFVDAEGGDYHLKRKSPCKDKGAILDWTTASATDRDGRPRVIRNGKTLAEDPSARPDLGCYENQAPNPGLMLLLR